MSRRARQRHSGPYEAAVVPSIGNVAAPAIPSELSAEVADASQAIARFDAEKGAALGTYSSLLLRSESAASSQIENLTASARNIALAEIGRADKQNASLIVANTRAMNAALALADELTSEAIVATHAVLLTETQPDIVGAWRQDQVWVGGEAYGPHQAMFVPPHHEFVGPAMEDLIVFLHRNDMPVLTHAAISHAHFETIHPFPDGNGRTGRTLVHALLRAKGLTQKVTVPISGGLLANVDRYFDALTAYREGDVSPIVQMFVDAAFHAINNATILIDELEEVRRGWEETVTARSDSAVWSTMEVLLARPIVDSALLSEKLGVATKNALRAIDRLESAGVVREMSGKGRNRLWEASAVLAALDGFAARAGRRQQPA